MPPLNATHWANIGSFITKKSQERKLTEVAAQVDLFREFWTELSDESLMQLEADNDELSKLEGQVRDEDAARAGINGRITTLRTKLGRGGSGSPGQSGRGRPK